jgi:hypothetical protein
MLAPFLLSTLLAIVPEPVAPRVLHVRPLTEIARTILNDARRRSSTIDGMLQEIEQSDVIVFIDLQHDMSHHGQTTLFSANPLARYVRMVVDIGLTPERRIELIGHELQHVVEIARATDVRDEDGMRRLFTEIGWEMQKGSFETSEARATESKVRRDMGRRQG